MQKAATKNRGLRHGALNIIGTGLTQMSLNLKLTRGQIVKTLSLFQNLKFNVREFMVLFQEIGDLAKKVKRLEYGAVALIELYDAANN